MSKIMKLELKELLGFIDSNLDELEYFDCKDNPNKEGLILLTDYITKLKERNEEYYRLGRTYIDSIKEKNKWVRDVTPNPKQYPNALWIQGKNIPSIPTNIDDLDDEKELYNLRGSLLICGVLGRLKTSLYLKNRLQVLSNSQNELRELGTISRDLGFKKREDKITESKRFYCTIYDFFNDYQGGTLSYCEDRYLVFNLINDNIYENINSLKNNKDKNLLSENQSKKLFSKLYVKKN